MEPAVKGTWHFCVNVRSTKADATVSFLALFFVRSVPYQVKEIALQHAPTREDGLGLRWQSSAILALQEASEAWVTSLDNHH